MKEITLKEYAEKYNPVKTRRGHKMSYGYLYRLIRLSERGASTRKLWFDYKFVGEKEAIFIIIK